MTLKRGRIAKYDISQLDINLTQSSLMCNEIYILFCKLQSLIGETHMQMELLMQTYEDMDERMRTVEANISADVEDPHRYGRTCRHRIVQIGKRCDRSTYV